MAISFEEVPVHVGTMHLLMTKRAVLKTGAPQIVQRRGYGSERSVGGRCGTGQVGVTLQADEAHLGACQHARVSRAVRLVACPAALGFDGGVFEHEGAALVAMAFETAGLVGIDGLNHGPRDEAAVRVMAIDARHGAFRDTMLVGSLEAGPHIRMALGALRIHIGRLARYQAVRSILVNRVTGGATHLVFGMTTINPSHVGGLIEMAGEAELVGGRGLQLGRLHDVRRAHGFGMLAARAMARFTGFGFKAAFLAGLDYLMRILLKGVENVFVATLAGCGAYKLGGFIVGWSFSGGARFLLGAPRCG